MLAAKTRFYGGAKTKPTASLHPSRGAYRPFVRVSTIFARRSAGEQTLGRGSHLAARSSATAGERTRGLTGERRATPRRRREGSARGSIMVDLAALARQMKAIGRKGSGKDYYEQYVAQGIQNGEARAKRAPAPDGREPLPDWLVNYGVPLRPASAPAARRTQVRNVRDDPIYHKTGVLYAQYDGGAVQKPRVVQQASVASTATPADSVAKWPTRWRQKVTTPFAGRALQGILKDKAAKHKRDQINSKSQRVRKPY